MWHELAANKWNEAQARSKNQSCNNHDELRAVQSPIQLLRILFLHPLIRAVPFFAYSFLEPIRSEHRGQGEGEEERADQRERHGFGHRMEQFSGGTAECINGKVSGENNCNGIKDGTINIFGGSDDDFVQGISLSFPKSQLAINVFHHHDGTVNNDAKINCANREEIGRPVVRMERDEREQQRKRNRDSDNNRGAKADQKENQHQEHEDHAAEQIIFDGGGC